MRRVATAAHVGWPETTSFALTALALLVAVVWLALLMLPGQPWGNRFVLEPLPGNDHELHDVTVLIPARDERLALPHALAGLTRQGHGLRVLVVDDQSGDDTVALARASAVDDLHVLHGRDLPAGWSGKVWAQHQAQSLLDRPLTLLLDADIELAPGMLAALRSKLHQDDAALVSVMASLRTKTAWEKLLIPAFIYFFKLLYPFPMSNDPRSRVAAAAGGCVLLRTDALRRAGGFASIRNALIDDCALARRVKSLDERIWIGQSTAVVSHRSYSRLGDIWNMVARTAFTQLGYSAFMLIACTAAMLLLFAVPGAAVLWADGIAALAGAVGLAVMLGTFLPTVTILGLSPAWSLALPLAAAAYLGMTWTSALRYWRGERSVWRGRRYHRGRACGG